MMLDANYAYSTRTVAGRGSDGRAENRHYVYATPRAEGAEPEAIGLAIENVDGTTAHYYLNGDPAERRQLVGNNRDEADTFDTIRNATEDVARTHRHWYGTKTTDQQADAIAEPGSYPDELAMYSTPLTLRRISVAGYDVFYTGLVGDTVAVGIGRVPTVGVPQRGARPWMVRAYDGEHELSTSYYPDLSSAARAARRVVQTNLAATQ